MFFDLDQLVGHITENATKQIWEAFAEKLEDEGITRVQWTALYYIKTKGKISQRDLSNLMYIKDSSAGRLIDRMERGKLVKRERSDIDKRVVLINVTKKGEELISELMHVGIEFNHSLVEGIDERDIQTYKRVLDKMITNIKTEREVLTD